MGGSVSLFSLVERGDLDGVEAFLRDRSSDGTLQIDAIDEANYDYTALHYAAKGGSDLDLSKESE
jgi:hypothetical protein